MLLKIEHETLYRYALPVPLGTHRLMLRPLEGHDVQIRSSALSIEPAGRVRWIRDIFDNSIALVDFPAPAAELKFVSTCVVEQFNTNPFDFILDSHVSELPFQYRPADTPDVAPFLLRQHPQDDGAIQNWIRPFQSVDGRAKTLDFLIALNKSVPLFFQYNRREEPGVQSPAETLRLRGGSCRDFALLLMETARYLGLAARFVSGYLCESSAGAQHIAASGATHAWAEIYLPGAGWRGFDPTCGTLAADLHVRTAVSRDPAQAAPISGSFTGRPTDYLGMEVIVRAHTMDTGPSS